MKRAHTSFAGLAEIALNRTLALDPDTLGRLAALEGRTLAVAITGTPWSTALAPHAAGIALLPAENPDATVRGDLAGVLAYFGRGRAGHVTVEGDQALATALAEALRGARPDVEDALARVLGDVAARRLTEGTRDVAERLRDAGDSLLQSFAEYLQHEQPALPSAEEYAAFTADLATLTATLERLEARVDRLRRDA